MEEEIEKIEKAIQWLMKSIGRGYYCYRCKEWYKKEHKLGLHLPPNPNK